MPVTCSLSVARAERRVCEVASCATTPSVALATTRQLLAFWHVLLTEQMLLLHSANAQYPNVRPRRPGPFVLGSCDVVWRVGAYFNDQGRSRCAKLCGRILRSPRHTSFAEMPRRQENVVTLRQRPLQGSMQPVRTPYRAVDL